MQGYAKHMPKFQHSISLLRFARAILERALSTDDRPAYGGEKIDSRRERGERGEQKQLRGNGDCANGHGPARGRGTACRTRRNSPGFWPGGVGDRLPVSKGGSLRALRPQVSAASGRERKNRWGNRLRRIEKMTIPAPPGANALYDRLAYGREKIDSRRERGDRGGSKNSCEAMAIALMDMGQCGVGARYDVPVRFPPVFGQVASATGCRYPKGAPCEPCAPK